MVQTAKIVDEASFGEINQLLLGVYDLLALDKFNGSINLGAKKRQVNWAQMPLEIAAIFLPEFDHRPEEISDFKISQLETTNPRFRGLSLTLFRNSEWTSRLDSRRLVHSLLRNKVLFRIHGNKKSATRGYGGCSQT